MYAKSRNAFLWVRPTGCRWYNDGHFGDWSWIGRRRISDWGPVALYHFMTELRKNKVEMRNYEVNVRTCKSNLRTSGCGKSRWPLVHHIGQVNTLVISLLFDLYLLILLVKRTKIDVRASWSSRTYRRTTEHCIVLTPVHWYVWCPTKVCPSSLNPSISNPGSDDECAPLMGSKERETRVWCFPGIRLTRGPAVCAFKVESDG